MKRCTLRNGVRHEFLVGLLAAGAYLAMAVPPAFPGESQPVSSGQMHAGSSASLQEQGVEKPDPGPGGAPGMMIYIDPQTGAILKEPAAGTVSLQLNPQLQNSLDRSQHGLRELASPVQGGGITVDLQGRFQSPVIATIDANGNLKIQHLHEMPESGNKK